MILIRVHDHSSCTQKSAGGLAGAVSASSDMEGIRGCEDVWWLSPTRRLPAQLHWRGIMLSLCRRLASRECAGALWRWRCAATVSHRDATRMWAGCRLLLLTRRRRTRELAHLAWRRMYAAAHWDRPVVYARPVREHAAQQDRGVPSIAVAGARAVDWRAMLDRRRAKEEEQLRKRQAAARRHATAAAAKRRQRP